jgi:EAL domain-containing protein (putative c-di-GMP-specific phosphodiesterase class I)
MASFKVVLDDFATGYSGPSLPADLRPDLVKLGHTLEQGYRRDRIRLAAIASRMARDGEVWPSLPSLCGS